jgi:hypothetical protein
MSLLANSLIFLVGLFSLMKILDRLPEPYRSYVADREPPGQKGCRP